MLVLTRWVEEVIVIDSAIRVTVVSVRGTEFASGSPRLRPSAWIVWRGGNDAGPTESYRV